MEITVSPENANVESSTVVLVDQTLDAEVIYSEPLIQVHSGNNYVLSSEGQYASNGLVGQLPKWLLDAVEQKLSTGDGNIISVVNDMKTLVDSLSIGVNQVIGELNTLSLSQNSLATSVSSQLQEDKAQIMNILASKVDSTGATAIATQAIDSKFGGDVDAYIGNIASTYVDDNSAIAQNLEVLRTTLGDVSASVTDISSATVENVLNPAWVDDGNGTDPDINGNSKWILQAKAKKQLQVDANGVITGILLDSGQTSSITMTADQFKVVASGQNVASRNPFSVDAATGDISFNGKVSFSSVTDAPNMVADNTNINVNTNLVPNSGWYATTHADYLFVGTPTYLKMIGAGSVQEDTLLLNVGDEVYTPYITDFTKSYKISYAFKGSATGAIVQINGTTWSSTDIIPTGTTIDPAKWYIAQIAVLPNGSTAGSLFGKVYDVSNMNVVASINDVSLDSTTTKFCVGFAVTADTYLSRVAIEEITSDTISGIPVTAGNLNTALASNTTVIDGGKIVTGSVTAEAIAAGAITTGKIAVGTGIVDGYIQSNDFSLSGGTGFRLKSNAAGTGVDPTIYGAYIKGGTIDSSTMNVRNLVVLTDAGLSTKPLLTFGNSRQIGYVSKQSLTYATGLFAYNASDASATYRFASISGQIIECPNPIVNTNIIGGGGNWISSVSVYRGATLLGTYNLVDKLTYTPVKQQVGGVVTFYGYVWYDNPSDGPGDSGTYLEIVPEPVTSFSGDGELIFKFNGLFIQNNPNQWINRLPSAVIANIG